MSGSGPLRHGYVELPEVRLHYVEAGSGPLVVLLHGFPEFWYTWRHLIPALADAGYRVVAPDTRGINQSAEVQRQFIFTFSRVTHFMVSSPFAISRCGLFS